VDENDWVKGAMDCELEHVEGDSWQGLISAFSFIGRERRTGDQTDTSERAVDFFDVSGGHLVAFPESPGIRPVHKFIVIVHGDSCVW